MCKSTQLSGVVKNAELAIPLEDVLIFQTLSVIDNPPITKTDDSGQWSCFTNDDCCKITFQKEGYISKSFNVDNVPKVIRLLKDKLIGYQLGVTYYPGDTVRCHIHCSQMFTATLCRHGVNKEIVQQTNNLPPCIQCVPNDNFVSEGLCWENNYTYTIPKEIKPGLFSLLLTSDNQEPFAIPLVVCTKADKTSKNKLLVLVSTNNWLAYNFWGGRSRYRNNESGESRQFTGMKTFRTKVNRGLSRILSENQILFLQHLVGRGPKNEKWKFERLSIHRPITNCLLEGVDPREPFTNHLASGEWRLFAWLESQGHEYDVITGEALHNNREFLKDCSALIFSTHCEYWSREMFYAVKKYHEENGLWIINVSGNTMYREVEIYKDGSLRCTSLRFTHSCEDETKLIGVRFSYHDYATAAPYKVTKPNHWIFDGIDGIGLTSVFGEASLNQNTKNRLDRYDSGRPGEEYGLMGQGASGWETDKLSKTAPKDFTIVAKGLNKGGGADMVIREPSGTRGGVFSASSITFTGSLLIDKSASSIINNVIRVSNTTSQGGISVDN